MRRLWVNIRKHKVLLKWTQGVISFPEWGKVLRMPSFEVLRSWRSITWLTYAEHALRSFFRGMGVSVLVTTRVRDVKPGQTASQLEEHSPNCSADTFSGLKLAVVYRSFLSFRQEKNKNVSSEQDEGTLQRYRGERKKGCGRRGWARSSTWDTRRRSGRDTRTCPLLSEERYGRRGVLLRKVVNLVKSHFLIS